MHDQAHFELSMSALRQQLAALEQHSDSISYSLKTNYEVGKVLQQISNCMVSVHSPEESTLIRDPARQLYFAQAWDQEELRTLLQRGITSFVVDNKNDLDILLNSLTKPINLMLRMRLKEHSVHTGKHFVYGFYSAEVNKLIPMLKANRNISKLGIHFHRKTQNVSEWSIKDELQQSLLPATLGKITIVNIGGGLPSVYVNYRPEIINPIFSKITELRQWLTSQNIQMIIEPGRFIAAPAIKLITKIKNIYNDTIIINASVYNAAMDTFIANIRLLVQEESPEGQSYTIKGCTPDSVDIFRYKVYLKDPKIGDTLTFLNAGAYNFTTDFCLLPKLETKIVE
ncbi:MAG: decarboxylase [Candidatus Woesearchaeota archaeon]